jgi:hypothetical protein
MITEIVTLRLPQAATREEIIAKFEKTAPAWRENPDLIRKSYLYDADNGIVGGVYLWSDKSDAEKWRATSPTPRSGMAPSFGERLWRPMAQNRTFGTLKRR